VALAIVSRRHDHKPHPSIPSPTSCLWPHEGSTVEQGVLSRAMQHLLSKQQGLSLIGTTTPGYVDSVDDAAAGGYSFLEFYEPENGSSSSNLRVSSSRSCESFCLPPASFEKYRICLLYYLYQNLMVTWKFGRITY
jgi:hypothetical protein